MELRALEEALHGDFEGGPLTAASSKLVAVCRRDG